MSGIEFRGGTVVFTSSTWAALSALGRDGTSSSDEPARDRGDVETRAWGFVASAEDRGERIPRALGFGCARSFCSASKMSAARLLLKDLRTRCPSLSRQSA